MHIELPKEVQGILDKLYEQGFEGYAVGGCVRDSILGRKPEDWDITTDARPNQVKKIFKRTIDTGIKHGTVTVMLGKNRYEVTTYRLDGNYTDGRHPDAVCFTPSLEEDLKRRDFTINAMAYSDREGLKDLFGGIQDLDDRCIRCVGDPMQRFGEDTLRILRAVRFAAQLDFSVEAGTAAVIGELSNNLKHVSKERIFAELNKILLSDHPEKIQQIYTYGIASNISDSFSLASAAIYDRPHIPRKKYIRWAAFFSGTDIKLAVKILRELKSDNETVEKMSLILKAMPEKDLLLREIKSRPKEKTEAFDFRKTIRRMLGSMGAELFDEWIILEEDLSNKLREGTKSDSVILWETLRRQKKEIIKNGDCFSLKNLAITGNELIELGCKQGTEIGRMLDELLDAVIENPKLNTKEELLQIVKEKNIRLNVNGEDMK